MVRGRQTGCLANSTVDIGDNPARPADDVMVVVADPGLVARDGARGLDLSHQARGGQGMQHVVHGLPGYVGQRKCTAPKIVSVSACGCAFTASRTATRGRVTRRSAVRSCSA